MQKELTLTKVRKIRNFEEITQYVMACKASGMTCKDWCRENNIPLTTYYGWQIRVFDATKADHEVEFAEQKHAVESVLNDVSSIAPVLRLICIVEYTVWR